MNFILNGIDKTCLVFNLLPKLENVKLKQMI